MAEHKTILPYRSIAPFQIGSNEALSTGALNRVIEHLLKNDDALQAAIGELNLTHSITVWNQTSIYTPGNVVVYVQRDTSSDETIAYILLCTSERNRKPKYTMEYGKPVFDSTGWRLIHSATFYLHSDDLLTNNILQPSVKASVTAHELGSEHKGEVVETMRDFGRLFLKENLENFTSERITRDDGTKENSFLNVSQIKSERAAEYNLRKFSDNVVELDITFSFDSTANQDVTILNERYYNELLPVADKSDNHIFSSFYKETTQTITFATNRVTYYNIRIPGTNVFSRVVEFPVEFVSTEYMIFQSPYVPDQFVFAPTAADLINRTSAGEQIFVSNILFVNKTTSSVTAVLPIHSHFSDYGKFIVGVPWVNEFKLRVVGQIK